MLQSPQPGSQKSSPAKSHSGGLAWRIGGALTYAALVTGAFAQGGGQAETDPKAPVSLKGLLPEEALGRVLTNLDELPENWDKWSEEAIQDIGKLYSETPEELSEQKAAIARLKTKIATLDTVLQDPRYGSLHMKLNSIRAGLNRRLETLDAVLDLLASDPSEGQAEALDSARTALSGAADSADAFLNSVQGGEGWKTYLQTAEARAALATEGDQKVLLEKLSAILERTRKAVKSEDPSVRTFAENAPLRAYVGGLDDAVSALQRVTGGVNSDKVREQIKALLSGLEKYEAESTPDAANEARNAFEIIRRITAREGGQLGAVLRKYYFNYNLRMAISEGFVNRVLANTHIEQGGVRDFILGADVYGCQITSTDTKFDLLPSEQSVRMRINLTGNVSTNTEGHKDHVIVYSLGNHNFCAFKDIYFGNDHFSTAPANMHVNTSNEPVDASTKLDRVPILNTVAKSIAINAAIEKRQEAEAIAAQRVTSRVGPEFDNEVDNKFTELNEKLQTKLIEPLKQESIYPDTRSYRSTDTELEFNSRLMSDTELGGGLPSLAPVAPGEISIALHESLINNFLDRLGVEGQTLTYEQLREKLENKLAAITGKEVSLPEKKPEVNTNEAGQPKEFILSQKHPLGVKIADGQISIILRTGFKREEGGDIAETTVTIPIAITIDGDELKLTRGDVEVGNGIAAIIQKVERQIEKEQHKSRTIKIDKAEGDPVDVNITSVNLVDGWLLLRMQ